MSATSVTGVGLGISNGKYKPENQAVGCCTKPVAEDVIIEPVVKTNSCSKIYITNNVASYKTRGNTKIKTC